MTGQVKQLWESQRTQPQPRKRRVLTMARCIEFAQMANLNNWEKSFIASVRNARVEDLTQKQRPVLRRLIKRGQAVAKLQHAKPSTITGLDRINTLVAKALDSKKTVKIQLHRDGIKVVLTATHNHPANTVSVESACGKWYGDIVGGDWMPSPVAPESVCYLVRDFGANPEGVARDHGFENKACCFCSRPLTDKRSTSVGYGPVCASNHGLVWGE